MNLKEAENLREIISLIETMGWEVRINIQDSSMYPKTIEFKVTIPEGKA